VTVPVTLRIALGNHHHVRALKLGRITSPRVKLSFREYDPLPKAFRDMVRSDELDASEMAVVTHLLALRFDRPVAGLPIPLWSRLPHANLVCPLGSHMTGPRDLEGKKVGVRAYTQTSGVWVRGILKGEYGVHLERITWITMEDAHLPEFQDPPIAQRNDRPASLRQLMIGGDVAAIMGEREVDPGGIRTVVPSAENAAKVWIERTGITPINHILTVRRAVLTEHPWLARELMELFVEARRIAVAEGAVSPPPYGFEANRRSLQFAFDYSYAQAITERPYTVEEAFLPL
jgi:4,5-dihydroxyphthalate decarboxylase